VPVPATIELLASKQHVVVPKGGSWSRRHATTRDESHDDKHEEEVVMFVFKRGN
jgi:hypothetical protein